MEWRREALRGRGDDFCDEQASEHGLKNLLKNLAENCGHVADVAMSGLESRDPGHGFHVLLACRR